MGYPNHPKLDHLKIILDNFSIETQGVWDHDIMLRRHYAGRS